MQKLKNDLTVLTRELNNLTFEIADIENKMTILKSEKVYKAIPSIFYRDDLYLYFSFPKGVYEKQRHYIAARHKLDIVTPCLECRERTIKYFKLKFHLNYLRECVKDTNKVLVKVSLMINKSIAELNEVIGR